MSSPGCIVTPGVSDVRVDTERVKLKPRQYFLLHKPSGVVCTHRDPAGRPLAVNLVPHQGQHFFTVGRLDEHTEGLLLVTNDGELAQRLAHPKYEVLRTYRALVAGDPNGDVFEQLKRGMHFREGKFRVQHVKRIKRQGRSTLIEIQLAEGQNREVRRLLAKVGHKVMHLQRVGFGPLRLGMLPRGTYRLLTPREKSELMDFAFSSGSSGKKGFEKHDKHRVRKGSSAPRSSKRPPRTREK